MMTDRERLLAILEGRSPDRLPWIPRMDIWYRAQINRNTLPDRFEGMTLRQLEKALGLGTPAREGCIHREEYKNVEVKVVQKGLDTITEYITPYYQAFSQLLHRTGKSLAMHADNDTSAILNHLKEAGFDMVECFINAPMARVTMQQARDVWGTSMIIWGGIPACILEDIYPEEDFEAYMMDLFRTIAPGDVFILGVSDNVMSNSLLFRIERISEMVERYGTYPIRV